VYQGFSLSPGSQGADAAGEGRQLESRRASGGPLERRLGRGPPDDQDRIKIVKPDRGSREADRRHRRPRQRHFKGLLAATDARTIVLRNVEAISDGPSSNVTVDGELLIPRGDVKFLQRP
jgi:hypothetical protein